MLRDWYTSERRIDYIDLLAAGERQNFLRNLPGLLVDKMIYYKGCWEFSRALERANGDVIKLDVYIDPSIDPKHGPLRIEMIRLVPGPKADLYRRVSPTRRAHDITSLSFVDSSTSSNAKEYALTDSSDEELMTFEYDPSESRNNFRLKANVTVNITIEGLYDRQGSDHLDNWTIQWLGDGKVAPLEGGQIRFISLDPKVAPQPGTYQLRILIDVDGRLMQDIRVNLLVKGAVQTPMAPAPMGPDDGPHGGGGGGGVGHVKLPGIGTFLPNYCASDTNAARMASPFYWKSAPVSLLGVWPDKETKMLTLVFKRNGSRHFELRALVNVPFTIDGPYDEQGNDQCHDWNFGWTEDRDVAALPDGVRTFISGTLEPRRVIKFKLAHQTAQPGTYQLRMLTYWGGLEVSLLIRNGHFIFQKNIFSYIRVNLDIRVNLVVEEAVQIPMAPAPMGPDDGPHGGGGGGGVGHGGTGSGTFYSNYCAMRPRLLETQATRTTRLNRLNEISYFL
ncbi:unnamed protein product, partial [Mesorhabditis belari]|uniref:Uncharacterized protein n=1 Tax=Mesorhabditis belari TaxID=2138241 RepID=A0AAF3EEY6_9BILA